jgi:osmotically-inducible protein OsmY
MGELTKRPDAEILREVREELAWDTNVEADRLHATVSEGVVTLTGTVGGWAARQAAQEAVRRISDVLDVVTDIVVVPKAADARQDTEIAHAVRHALEWHARVPHERIRTTVSAGVVTLEGEVDYWSQFDDVSKSVHDLIGVREVRNLIFEVTCPRRRSGGSSRGPSGGLRAFPRSKANSGSADLQGAAGGRTSYKWLSGSANAR